MCPLCVPSTTDSISGKQLGYHGRLAFKILMKITVQVQTVTHDKAVTYTGCYKNLQNMEITEIWNSSFHEVKNDFSEEMT
jgi:hypothetical protein